MSPEKRVQLLTAFVDNKTSPMEDISVFLSARNELEVMLTKEAVEMNKQLINEHVEKFGINRHGLARVRDFFIDLRLLNQHSINEAKEQEQEKNKQAEASKPHEQVEPEIDLSTLTADPKSVAELRKYASITVLALLLLVYGQTGFGFLTILCLIVAAGVIGLLFNSSTLNDMIVGYKRGKIEYKIKNQGLSIKKDNPPPQEETKQAELENFLATCLKDEYSLKCVSLLLLFVVQRFRDIIKKFPNQEDLSDRFVKDVMEEYTDIVTGDFPSILKEEVARIQVFLWLAIYDNHRSSEMTKVFDEIVLIDRSE